MLRSDIGQENILIKIYSMLVMRYIPDIFRFQIYITEKYAVYPPGGRENNESGYFHSPPSDTNNHTSRLHYYVWGVKITPHTIFTPEKVRENSHCLKN